MSAAYQMYAAGNCVKTTVVGNGIPPITSTPKKDITTTNHAAGSKSAMIAPNNQLLTQVRRRLDQQPTSTYHHMMMKHPTTNNNTTSAANVALRRSKSVANIPRPMKVPVGISTAANSSFSGVSTYYDHHHYLSSASAQPSPTKFYNPANTNNNVVITPQQRNLQRSISSVVRRPSDISISSARPLIASAAENNNKKRNTAIISPIYTKQQSFVRTPSSASRRINDASSTTTPAVPYSSFQVAANSSSRANASSNNNVTDDASSTSPSKRSWLLISATQNVPLCTLRTCAVILFITGALNCFLCLRITMEKGKSYELTFAFVASFAALCLGFPCFGFEKWQWLPNRNYVSGYIILCIFNSLQVINLWFLRSYTAYVHPAIGDIAKGALCGISALTLLISILGLIASYCCKFPPPDNRVSHAVEAFRV